VDDARLTHLFVQSADIISTVEFDSTGNYLATGDKGGRVVLFERNESVSTHSSSFSTCVLSLYLALTDHVLDCLPSVAFSIVSTLFV
jgi:hypothetical protein